MEKGKMKKKEENDDREFYLNYERNLERNVLRRDREFEKYMKLFDDLIRYEGKYAKFLLRKKKKGKKNTMKENVEQRMKNLSLELSRQEKILSEYDKEIENADNQLRDYIKTKRNEVEAEA